MGFFQVVQVDFGYGLVDLVQDFQVDFGYGLYNIPMQLCWTGRPNTSSHGLKLEFLVTGLILSSKINSSNGN